MYLDPGVGSMIIQVVLAGIATLGGVWLVFKKQLNEWIARRKSKRIADKEDTHYHD